MKKIPAILTAQVRSGETLSLDNPPLKVVLSFEGVDANADGLLSEADFFSLFDRAAEAYDALEETYARPEAA